MDALGQASRRDVLIPIRVTETGSCVVRIAPRLHVHPHQWPASLWQLGPRTLPALEHGYLQPIWVALGPKWLHTMLFVSIGSR
jgi:hypothetical protein